MGMYSQKGPRPWVSPGEVDHDVSASLMHLGESEWGHLTPYLEGLCHRLPYLFPYKLPWKPEDPGRGGEGPGHGARKPLRTEESSFPWS